MPELILHVNRILNHVKNELITRIFLSSDANAQPVSHTFILKPGYKFKIHYDEATITADTVLCWECLIMELAPLAEGGDLETVIIGGAISQLNGTFTLMLRDFYADSDDLISEMDITLEGLSSAHQALPQLSPAEEQRLINLRDKYFIFYENLASPEQTCDRRMHVPFFNFYGGQVQASFLCLLRGEMDREFAQGILEIVLSNAGMSEEDIVRIGEQQFRDKTEYREETAAIILRMGDFLTLTANLMRYRNDMNSPAAQDEAIIEKIIPHARYVNAGDCEDLAMEIYFCFHALRKLDTSEGTQALRIMAKFAKFYIPGLMTVIATAAAAGRQAAGGNILHLLATGLPIPLAKKIMNPNITTHINEIMGLEETELLPWTESLPTLFPLEGTNWVESFFLPIDRFYQQNAGDLKQLQKIRTMEEEIRTRVPAMNKYQTRIRQQPGASLDEERFSRFYRRAIELWMDFSEIGLTCFSYINETKGTYGVSISMIAAQQSHRIEPIFMFDPNEYQTVKKMLRTTAPISAWIGAPKKMIIEELTKFVWGEFKPKAVSRLYSDTIVYHLRSENIAKSRQLQFDLEALKTAGYDVNYRAYKLPPKGQSVYITIWVKI